MPRRQGNNPKRRIVPIEEVEQHDLDQLKRCVRYTGSPHHKRIPADYGFHSPARPRPNKSLCDGHRVVLLGEARELFLKSIDRGMISTYRVGEYPKYVWAVDAEERVFEAKIERGYRRYHGYELGDDESAMKQLVIEEWKLRCPVN